GMEQHGGVPPRRADYRENRLSRSIRPSSAVFPHYLSRSLHNVYTDSIGVPSWSATPSLSQAHLPQLIEHEEKPLERVESRPVLRRRRFKHRKSINLEPDTSVILARGVVESSSSEEEDERPVYRRLSVEQSLALARDQRSTLEPAEEPKLRGPSARRFNRRNQQRAHLSMHCLPISEGSAGGPPSAFSAVVRGSNRIGGGVGPHAARPATMTPVGTGAGYHAKAQSMADLHRGLDDEDALDFSSQASVSRWTSRMLAELESLPGSLMDINASSQSINRLGPPSDTVSMTSSTLSIDPPRHRNLMTSSLIVDSSDTSSNRSRRSSTLTASGPDATSTVSSRLAESISNLDALLLESASIGSGLDAIGRDTVAGKIEAAPPVPPHRHSLCREGERNSLMAASSDLSGSRLSILSHNTEASGETLKLDNEDGSSVRLSRTDPTLDLEGCEEEEEHEPSPIGDLPLLAPQDATVRDSEPKQQKRRSVLEDDKYPLLQSIYRLSQSMYADSPMAEDSQTERMERWQRNKKASCAERISSQPQLRAAKVASSISIDTPPPSVDHVVQSLLRAAKKSERKDAVTQTSPALSRSSSFDWLETGSAVPSTPVSLRLDESSGEDAADREVRTVNSAASARKMRLDATMDESLALLHMMAKDGVEQAAVSSPRNSRLCRVSRDSRALRSSALLQQQLQPASAARPTQLPAPVTAATRSTSSAMSESVYDNVHSERSRDDEDDDDEEDEVLSVTSSEMPPRPVLNASKFAPLKGVKSSPSGSSSPRASKFIDEQVPLPSTSSATAADDNSALKWTLSRAEDKAVEACRWLRSAGFPQYAHAYEEGSFPLQLDAVIADHAGILDTDSIHALSKRIATLNRCAIMRMDGVVLRDRSSTIVDPHAMHSDEDGVALSGNWRYQRHSQTWSRMADVRQSRPPMQLQQLQPVHRSLQLQRSTEQQPHQQLSVQPQRDSSSRNSSLLQRSHSERIKDRAKAIIKKMDVRSGNKKKDAHPPMVISDPVLVSYDSASPASMRMLPAGLAPSSGSGPPRLPANGKRAQGFMSPHPPSTRSKSSHARRQGIVFASPLSSPDSSDDSVQAAHVRLSRYGEGAPVRALAPPPGAARDRSVPSRFSRDYAVNRFSRGEAERQRERLPSAAEYLYPASASLTSARISSGQRVMSPVSSSMPRRAAGESSSSMTTSTTSSMTASPFGTPQMARRPIGGGGGAPRSAAALHAAMHGVSPDLDVRRLAPASSPRLLDGRLAVETRGGAPVAADSDVDEEERRDSGAGSSLSRSPSSAPCTLRLRQSQMQPASAAAAAAAAAVPLSCSFTSSTTASSCSSNGSCGRSHPKGEALQGVIPTQSIECFFSDAQLPSSIDALSAKDMALYRKISHLRVTSILEKHMFGGRGGMINIEDAPGSPASLFHKMIKRFKTGESKSKEDRSLVFGAPLSDIRRRGGACLPHAVFEILRFLRVHAPEAVGIFRKNGVKSRITELKEIANTEKEGDVFQDEQALNASQVHDVADLLKQYLRELPEPLMTSRLSKTFAAIFEHVPEQERLAALRYAIVLLPEENREALQTLLLFFNEVAGHNSTNQMTADNISVCLTPSLFALSASRLNSVTPSRRHKTIGGTGMPTEAEMAETRAAQKCLAVMITHVTDLFVVCDPISGEKHSEYEDDFPIMKSLNHSKGPRSYLQHRIQEITAERNERWPNWIVDGSHEGVEMSSKKSVDGHQLKHFRVWTDIAAPPRDLLHLIKNKRVLWDPAYLHQRLMENLGTDLDLFQYVWNDSPGHPTRDVCVVRLSVSDILLDSRTSAGCVLVERSVLCSETQLMGGVPAAVLEMKWLIEPHGQGRSRVTLVSRVDLRGRHADWYSAQYGYMMARSLGRLRDFHRPSCHDDGPETKI
ncbi:hypothetical protein PENTCL1PPCAC_12096, partial [Pristionchus entomophagus]